MVQASGYGAQSSTGYDAQQYGGQYPGYAGYSDPNSAYANGGYGGYGAQKTQGQGQDYGRYHPYAR